MSISNITNNIVSLTFLIDNSVSNTFWRKIQKSSHSDMRKTRCQIALLFFHALLMYLCYSRFCTITFGVQVHTMYLLHRIKSDCMIVNNYFTVCKYRQPLQLVLYQSGQSICTLESVKVSNSQKHFFLKLHCPKNYEDRAEFC